MILKDIQVYHPENEVSNNYYLKRFPEKKDTLQKLFKAMSKERRYISCGETSVEMAINVVRKVIEVNGLNRDDVGAIFFTSQTPEFLIPTNSVIIHNALDLKDECHCIDLNANCAGMTYGLETAHNYMKFHKECKYAIVVGSEHHSTHSSKDCVMTYPLFGDLACAVLLENTGDNMLVSKFNVKKGDTLNVKFPRYGLSKVNYTTENHILWGTARGGVEDTFKPAVDMTKALMTHYGISKEKIGLLTCNQLTYKTSEYLAEELELSDKILNYVGYRYGYTGATTSFVSLYHAIKSEKLKRGEFVLFCSSGAGGTMGVVLYEY